MKTIKFKFLTLLLIVAIITGACSLDDSNSGSCNAQYEMLIDAVAGPDTLTTKINVPIALQATFKIANGCGVFNRFLESVSYPKQIDALVDYTGCSCETAGSSVTKPYTFVSATPGTYVLQFVSGVVAGQTTYITKTITVTAE